MGKNYTGYNSTIKNKLSRLRKLGGDINSKGYTAWTEGKQLEFIKRLDTEIKKFDKNYKPKELKTSVNTAKPKKSSSNKEYRKYLRKTGMMDNIQARQNYEDIKKVTKLAREMAKHIDDMDNVGASTLNMLKSIISKGINVKDFINNNDGNRLRIPLGDQVEMLEDVASDRYITEILKKNGLGVSVEEEGKLREMFNKMSISKRAHFNGVVYSMYFSAYDTYMMMNGNDNSLFDSYETMQGIIKHMSRGGKKK